MTIRQTATASLSLFRVRLAQELQYRAAALSGVAVSIFWAFIECIILTVFYTHGQFSANSNGFSQPQAVSYVWLMQGLWLLMSMNIDGEILGKIRSGDIGLELCRPMDLYTHWFAKLAAGRLGGAWIRLVCTLGVGLLIPAPYAMGMPGSIAGFGLFLLSTLLSFLLCNAFAMLVTAIRINITWGDGPTYMLLLLSGILSGTYLPLRLWPDVLQGFLRLQPFAGFADIPGQLYVGSLAPADALPALMLQAFWILVFILAGRVVLRRRLKTIIVQGG